MTAPRVRALAALAATALVGTALVGCGGAGGATTTVAPDTDGVVTIQTVPVVTSGSTDAMTTTGGAGDALLDADVAALSSTITASLNDLRGTVRADDATTLAQSFTTRTQQFDRAVDTIRGAAVAGAAARALQAAILTAAPAVSDAYRQFVDAARQSADTNDTPGLVAAQAMLSSALATFGRVVTAP